MSKLDLSLNPQDRQALSTAIEKLIGLLDDAISQPALPRCYEISSN